jgi:hypothetical protein
VDENGYYTCWSWTKTDMTFSFPKVRGINRGRKLTCPVTQRCIIVRSNAISRLSNAASAVCCVLNTH